jgi:nucleoside phosphorylase
MNRSHLCAVVATSAERRIAQEAMPSVPIVQVGIGAPNVSRSTIPDCDFVLITGFAGALDSTLKTGDIVVYHRAVNLSGESIDCEPIKELPECARVSCLTMSQVIVKSTDKRTLRDQHHADVVDMETLQVLKVCREAGIRAAVLRVISDEAGDDLPDFNLAIQPDGTLDGPRLSRVLLARPLTTLKFVRSFKMSNSALRTALRRFRMEFKL